MDINGELYRKILSVDESADIKDKKQKEDKKPKKTNKREDFSLIFNEACHIVNTR